MRSLEPPVPASRIPVTQRRCQLALLGQERRYCHRSGDDEKEGRTAGIRVRQKPPAAPGLSTVGALAGTGTKAGGADYLLHFVDPIAVSENTMRHGFAPALG